MMTSPTITPPASTPTLFNLDAYFERIGYIITSDDSLKPTYENFLQITRRHAASIPFDNIDAFLYASVSVDLDKLFEKMILSKRGGYCLEQSALLCGALQHIGFDACMILGRAYGPFREKVPVRTHCVVFVRFEDGSAYLADAGGSGCTMTTPLQLRKSGSTIVDPYVDMCGVEQFTDNGKYKICREQMDRTSHPADPYGPPPLFTPNGAPYNPPQCIHTDPTLNSLYQTYGMYAWQPQKQKWSFSFTFDLQRQTPMDIHVANYYTATASTFRQRFIASRMIERGRDEAEEAGEKWKPANIHGPVDAECVITLMNTTFSRYSPSKTEVLESRTLTSAEEVYEILKNEFKFNLDDPKYGISLETLREKTHALFTQIT